MKIVRGSTRDGSALPAEVMKAAGLKASSRVSVDAHDGALVIRAVPDLFALKKFLGRGDATAQERNAAMRYVAGRHAAVGRRARCKSVDEVFGMLRVAERSPKTVAEMNRAVARRMRNVRPQSHRTRKSSV